jgi:alpha-L-arabinofuranosidase
MPDTRTLRSFGRRPSKQTIILIGLSLPLLIAGCNSVRSGRSQRPSSRITNIEVTDAVVQRDVKRLGINIGGQNYYDSGQMLRNLIFNNPGFEGETWQSILQCEGQSATSCTDPNQWNQWPVNFLKGAQFEVISGRANGASGTVTSSTAADSREKNQGVTIRFQEMNTPPDLDDFILVKKVIPGNAQAGWWTSTTGAAGFTTEFSDISPNSPGRQALKINAISPGASASVSSYFDSLKDHSFVHLNGAYRLSFRAKGLTGNRRLNINLRRMTAVAPEIFLNRALDLSSKWSDYNFDFNASEPETSIGTVGLTFNVGGAEILLDDVSLTPRVASGPNPTAFRDEIVDTLRQLKPGILRYQDGDHLGSSVDNLIAVPFARMRAGFSERASQQDSIPLGLHEFLQLCQTVGAEPWFNLPSGISPVEIENLIEYLSAPSSTVYGARRVALGQAAPWTSVFPSIHLELGNEEWNGVTFAGSAMPDPEAYGRRAKQIFAAARSSAYFQNSKIDLVIGSFVLIPDWTRRELAASGGYDSVAVAPYLFDSFNDSSSREAIFGPMFAQPEMMDSNSSGVMAKQQSVARSAAHPAKLSVYEVNLGTASGSASQSSVDQAVPSTGAGLALIDHMLLMIRDLGVKEQSVWALPGYSNHFENSQNHKDEKTPLFGVVVDMGGSTNLRRPQFLAEQLANSAILPTMFATRLTGANPEWSQPLSSNDEIMLSAAHCLQTFAFSDQGHRSLIVLNLSRTEYLPLTFSGIGTFIDQVRVSQLTSKDIADSNEMNANVRISETTLDGFKQSNPFIVPPFSMTVLQWSVKQ